MIYFVELHSQMLHTKFQSHIPFMVLKLKILKVFAIYSQYSNIFFSKTAWPIKAKLYVEHPQEEWMKVCINSHGHMTKMATMAINNTNLKKSSSSEPGGL